MIQVGPYNIGDNIPMKICENVQFVTILHNKVSLIHTNCFEPKLHQGDDPSPWLHHT